MILAVVSASHRSLVFGAALAVAGAVAGAAAGPARAQGCVVSRQTAPVPDGLARCAPRLDGWEVSAAYRSFRSHRPFAGDEEVTGPEVDALRVENDVHALDLEVAYAAGDRWTLFLGLPFLAATRTEPVPGTAGPTGSTGSTVTGADSPLRARTSAAGLGDAVLGARLRLLDPERFPTASLSVGFGLELPTGASEVTDTVATPGGASIERQVDDSILPGDGGFGVPLSVEAAVTLGSFTPFLSASWLVTPQESVRHDTPNVHGETRYSIRDQFLARAGSLASLPWGLSAGLGGRIEGTPSRDLVGGSGGRRQPGHVVSVEPLLAWSRGDLALAASLPVALYRRRTPSPDELAGLPGVTPRASFADYALTLSVSYRFSRPAADGAACLDRTPPPAPPEPPRVTGPLCNPRSASLRHHSGPECRPEPRRESNSRETGRRRSAGASYQPPPAEGPGSAGASRTGRVGRDAPTTMSGPPRASSRTR